MDRNGSTVLCRLFHGHQVFDILPIYGKLEPGETQVATFTCSLKTAVDVGRLWVRSSVDPSSLVSKRELEKLPLLAIATGFPENDHYYPKTSLLGSRLGLGFDDDFPPTFISGICDPSMA